MVISMAFSMTPWPLASVVSRHLRVRVRVVIVRTRVRVIIVSQRCVQAPEGQG